MIVPIQITHQYTSRQLCIKRYTRLSSQRPNAFRRSMDFGLTYFFSKLAK